MEILKGPQCLIRSVQTAPARLEKWLCEFLMSSAKEVQSHLRGEGGGGNGRRRDALIPVPITPAVLHPLISHHPPFWTSLSTFLSHYLFAGIPRGTLRLNKGFADQRPILSEVNTGGDWKRQRLRRRRRRIIADTSHWQFLIEKQREWKWRHMNPLSCWRLLLIQVMTVEDCNWKTKLWWRKGCQALRRSLQSVAIDSNCNTWTNQRFLCPTGTRTTVDKVDLIQNKGSFWLIRSITAV